MSAPARPARTPAAGIRRVPRPRRLGLAPLARRLVLAALEEIEGGELVLDLPDGSVRRFGEPSGALRVAAMVHDDDLFRRVALRGSVGLGESYVAGEWDAEDLPALFELLLRGADRAASRWPYSALVKAKELRPHLPGVNGPSRARRHVSYHYDLGNELFALFLDDALVYSCALFEHEGQPLEAAQQAKLRRMCDRLGIGPDDHVLEIGCGWGGFALHAARERGARVTGVTISAEQHELARLRVAAEGLEDRVDIALLDYRQVEGTFTKIVSIEMFEAIGERQFGTFFATCDRLLAPGGLVGLQVIVVPDQRFRRYRKTRDWIQTYVFPGSLIPSLSAMTKAMTRSSSFVVDELENIGPHYAETLRHWRDRFRARLPEVAALGYDERFVRTWEYYLASCEALFRTGSLGDLQLVLRRPTER